VEWSLPVPLPLPHTGSLVPFLTVRIYLWCDGTVKSWLDIARVAGQRSLASKSGSALLLRFR